MSTGHSDDAGSSTNDIRLIRVPRQRWPEGSKRPVYFWQAACLQVSSLMLPVAKKAATANPCRVPGPAAHAGIAIGRMTFTS